MRSRQIFVLMIVISIFQDKNCEKLAQKTPEKKILLHRHVLIQFFLYSLTTDGRMENVVVYGLQKRYSPEKHYVFILEITRENVKGKINLWQTFS